MSIANRPLPKYLWLLIKIADLFLSLQQERSNSSKTPTSAKSESKVLKRKLFSPTATTSDDEGKSGFSDFLFDHYNRVLSSCQLRTSSYW